MYVVSPWSRGGWVNSQAFDHTSVIRFIEARFGVKEPNISPYRRAALGDLTSAFNFRNPNDERLPRLAGRKTKAEADALRVAQQALPQIVPPAGRGLPVQETGVRPSRALPYDLHVASRVDDGRGTVKLAFANTGDAAAVFHVYDQFKLDAMPSRQALDPATLLAFRDAYPMPRRYMVEPGKVLDDVWAVQAENGGRYDLWVLGPNGFHRRFRGDLATLRGRRAPAPELSLSYDPRLDALRLDARNDGGSDVVLTVRSNKVYGNLRLLKGHAWPFFQKPGGGDTEWQIRLDARDTQSLHWNLDSTGWWYDFAVTSDADRSFLRRFAGRAETGRHSVSDPAMGLADRF